MLLLTSINDRLQVVTSSGAIIHIHTSWVDSNTGAGTITPGRTNSAVSGATTSSIAGAPAAGVQRNIKTIHIRNADASLSDDVTIQHTDGTVVAQLYKRTLAPNEWIEYTDQGGFASTVPAPLALPPKALNGLTLGYIAGGTSLNIDVGHATSDDNTAQMVLATALNKTTGAWAVGNSAGALDVGVIGAAWYHVYLIKRVDTGVVDVLFSLSASAPAMPPNYTKKRRIGSFRTAPTTNLIYPFLQIGDKFLWTTPFSDQNNLGLAAGNQFVVVSTPLGVRTEAHFTAFQNTTVAGLAFAIEFHSPDQTGAATEVPAGNIAMYSFMSGPGVIPGVGEFFVFTNTASQIVASSTSAFADGFYLVTKGWRDSRGK